MKDSRRGKLSQDLFRSSVDSSPTSDGPHLIDDDELLISWSLGELDEDQHAALVAHMAECSYCRQEVAAMVKAEALVLPNVEESQQTVQLARDLPVSPALSPKRTTKWAIWGTLAAMAAALMLIVWIQTDKEPLAVAQRELQAGNAQAAMKHIETLLEGNKNLSPKTRTQARVLLQRAGYQVVLNHLDQEDFLSAIDVENRISSHAGDSAELLNLKLQAERRVPSEFALAMNDSLTDYGYELNGFASDKSDKSFPTIDEKAERLGAEFDQAVAEFTDDVSLRLNYGHFLLEQRRFDQARDLFNAVLAKEKESVLAYVGLGLIAFELERFAEALQQFEAAIRIDANNPSTHINAAICLEKLNQVSDAHTHWQQAAELTTDIDMRKQLEKRIPFSD